MILVNAHGVEHIMPPLEGGNVGRLPQVRGGRGDRHAEMCTAVRSGHEQKESAGHPEPPSGPPESLACDEMQTATAGMMLAQTVSEQGEVEACEMPLP